MKRHDIHWRKDRECWICSNCGRLWEQYPRTLAEEGECDA